MKIFLLKRKGIAEREQVQEAVVAAPTEQEARQIMSHSTTGDLNPLIWEESKWVTCRYLGDAHDRILAGIVCKDVVSA